MVQHTATETPTPAGDSTATKKGLFGRMKAKLSFRKQASSAANGGTVTPDQFDIKPETTTPEKSTTEQPVQATGKGKSKGSMGGSPLRDMRAQAATAASVQQAGSPTEPIDSVAGTDGAAAADTGAELVGACELFGGEVAALMVSAAWKDKKSALEILAERVCASRATDGAGTADAALGTEESERRLAAACVIGRAAAIDAVAPVCFAAIEFLASAFKVLAPLVSKQPKLSAASATGAEAPVTPSAAPTAWAMARGPGKLEALVPVLLLKMNDSNKRMQRDVCRCIIKIAQARRVHGLKTLLPYLAHAEIDGTPLPLRPRLALLRVLLNEFGFQKGLLNLTLCMGVAVPALGIAEDKTRKAAVAVVVAAHNKVGAKRVERHLKGVKPAMLAILHRKFAEAGTGAGTDAGTAGGAGAGAGPLASVKLGGGALPRLDLAGVSVAPLLPLGATTDSVNATHGADIEARRLGPIASASPLAARKATQPAPAGGDASGAAAPAKYQFQGSYGCGGNDFGKPTVGTPVKKASASQSQSQSSFQSEVFECGDDELMDSILAEL